jgi:TatD DNase family protein
VRCERELQQRVFKEILDLAKDHGKPVLIHGRAAWEDAVSFAKDSGVERAVFHWYSGPNNVLDEIIRAGFFMSATPAAAYSERHRKAIERVPLENLLLETDSPVSYRGKTAEPADALVSLRCVAEIKGITASEVAERTTENAMAFFELP